MSRDSYSPTDSYTGNGSLASYDFDFKIEAKSQLEIVSYDADGVEQWRVDGNDVVRLTSVTFNSGVDEAGGTVNLAANLPAGHKLFIILAAEQPVQTQQYRNKGTFTLKVLEAALDLIVGPIVRNTYLSTRSIVASDFDDVSSFSFKLPSKITDSANAERVIALNGQASVTGATGFKLGPTTGQIENAQTYALAAQAAQVAAEAAQDAAEAAGAAAFSDWVEHSVTDNQSATDLSGETLTLASHSSVHYMFEIIRGTTVVANGVFAIQNVNGTPRVVTGYSMSTTPHGVTFTVSLAAGVAQLRAALDAGAGNGTIKLSRRRIPV